MTFWKKLVGGERKATRFVIVARANLPQDKSFIRIPEFSGYMDSLAAAIDLVEKYCRAKGLQITDAPSAVGFVDWIFGDSDEKHKIVKAWAVAPTSRICIFKVEEVTDGEMVPYDLFQAQTPNTPATQSFCRCTTGPLAIKRPDGEYYCSKCGGIVC